MSDFAALFSGRSHGLVLPRSDEEHIVRYVAMHSSERGERRAASLSSAGGLLGVQYRCRARVES